jgi:three-Cys-motif partner protein
MGAGGGGDAGGELVGEVARRRHRAIDPTAAAGTLFPFPDPQRPQPRVKNPLLPVWTENKARLIERYPYYFVMITKGGNYIDAFAGPQDPDKPDTWAAKLVLENRPRWLTQFHLFEIDPKRVRSLETLVAAQPPRDRHKREPKRTVEIYAADFNERIPAILNSGAIKPTRATFCLLDQRTFECRWASLKALADYKRGAKIELFYFLANAWLPRALAAVQDTSILDAWWGNSGWQGLRAMRGVERAYLFATRLRQELGYWSAEPWPIYERRNGGHVMYYMIHATDHAAAPGLMARAYHRAVLPKESVEQVRLELGLTPP